MTLNSTLLVTITVPGGRYVSVTRDSVSRWISNQATVSLTTGERVTSRRHHPCRYERQTAIQLSRPTSRCLKVFILISIAVTVITVVRV